MSTRPPRLRSQCGRACFASPRPHRFIFHQRPAPHSRTGIDLLSLILIILIPLMTLIILSAQILINHHNPDG